MRTEIAETVTFGVAGNAADYQSHGWYQPESQFTWMEGQESALTLPMPDALHGLFVEAQLFTFLPEGTAERMLAIVVNGQSCGEPSKVTAGTYAWYVPPSPNTHAKCVITLRHPNPGPPKQTDPRALSAGLRWLRLHIALEPVGRLTDKRCAIELGQDDPQARAAARYLTDLSVADLVSRFENLGDDCEAGLVQRRCGAEPLGLFRFCHTFLACALRAVDTDFLGMGEQLDVALEDKPQEWMGREYGYSMRWHTFLHGNDGTHDQMLTRERKKMAFLVRKIRADIAEGTKIFTVKSQDADVAVEQIIPLHLALNRRRANWMLWVTRADAGHPAGLVEEILPRLMRGYIDRFTLHAGENVETVAGWLAVFANAWLVRHRCSGRRAHMPDESGLDKPGLDEQGQVAGF